jgi:hypothetical protein
MLIADKLLTDINVDELTHMLKCKKKDLTAPVSGVQNSDSLVAPAGLNSIALPLPSVLRNTFCVCI